MQVVNVCEARQTVFCLSAAATSPLLRASCTVTKRNGVITFPSSQRTSAQLHSAQTAMQHRLCAASMKMMGGNNAP